MRYSKTAQSFLLTTLGLYIASIGADSSIFSSGNVILYLNNKTKAPITVESTAQEIKPGATTTIGSLPRKSQPDRTNSLFDGAGNAVLTFETRAIKIILPKLNVPLYLHAQAQNIPAPKDSIFGKTIVRGILFSDVSAKDDFFTIPSASEFLAYTAKRAGLPFYRPTPKVKFFKQNKDCGEQCAFYKTTVTHTRGDLVLTPDIYYTVEEVVNTPAHIENIPSQTRDLSIIDLETLVTPEEEAKFLDLFRGIE